ncbi:MAG: ribosome silencing factor [Verrucomicrobiota bacterium]
MSAAAVDTLKMARVARDAAEDKKATDPVILDLRTLTSIADYFVILSVQSQPQLKAVVSGVRTAMKDEFNLKPEAVDGAAASQWIVADYGDIMVHIFHQDMRARYDLEQVWGDAPRVD